MRRRQVKSRGKIMDNQHQAAERSTLLKQCSTTVSRINVEIPLLLYMISSFLQYPNTQAFIYTKSCLTLFNDTSFCDNSTSIHDNHDIQTMASHMLLISSLCQTLISIPTTIMLGAYGDRHSRKWSIILPFIGVILADVNYVVQSSYMNLNIYFVFISDLVFGLFGGFASIISTIFSYAAEDSPVGKRRSNRMAILEGCIGLGGTLGYVLSSLLNMAYLEVRVIYLTALILHASAFVCIVALIRELRSRDNVSNVSGESRGRSILGAICTYVNSALTCAFKQRENKARRIILIILLSFLFNYLIFAGSQDIMYYYLHGQLNFSVGLYSYYLGLTFASSTIMVLFLYPCLKRKNLSDCTLALIGVVSRMIGSLTLCFPISNLYIFIMSVFYMFNRFSAAGMRSVVSRQVSNEEQGQIFALIALIQGVCTLLASAIFNALYPITLKFYAGFCFALMGAMALVPIGGLIYVYRLIEKSAAPNRMTSLSTNQNLIQADADSAIGSEDLLRSGDSGRITAEADESRSNDINERS